MSRRVKATKPGYAPRVPGAVPERIAVGEIIEVSDKAKGKWFEDVDGKRGRQKAESPFLEYFDLQPFALNLVNAEQ